MADPDIMVASDRAGAMRSELVTSDPSRVRKEAVVPLVAWANLFARAVHWRHGQAAAWYVFSVPKGRHEHSPAI